MDRVINCLPCQLDPSRPNWLPNTPARPRSPELLAHLEEVARTAPR